MRRQYQEGIAPTLLPGKKKRQPDWEMLRQACATAKEAAPYIHPRLASVEIIEGMPDDDLDAAIMARAVAAGIPLELMDMEKLVGQKGDIPTYVQAGQREPDPAEAQPPTRIQRRPATPQQP